MRARGRGDNANDALADRWHSLAIHLLRRLRREDLKAGLTGPRLSALSVIVFGGPITLGELAAPLGELSASERETLRRASEILSRVVARLRQS